MDAPTLRAVGKGRTGRFVDWPKIRAALTAAQGAVKDAEFLRQIAKAEGSSTVRDKSFLKRLRGETPQIIYPSLDSIALWLKAAGDPSLWKFFAAVEGVDVHEMLRRQHEPDNTDSLKSVTTRHSSATHSVDGHHSLRTSDARPDEERTLTASGQKLAAAAAEIAEQLQGLETRSRQRTQRVAPKVLQTRGKESVRSRRRS